MIKVHSSVALITNSSTTIYSSATEYTIKQIGNLFNAVLKIAGSDKTFDDLFDACLVPDAAMFERELDYLSDCLDLDEDPEYREDDDILNYLSEDEVKQLLDWENKNRTDLLEKAIKAGYVMKGSQNDYYGCGSATYEVKVTDKNGNDVNVQALLSSVETWESHE